MEITSTIKLNEEGFEEPKVDVKIDQAENNEPLKNEPSKYARFFDESNSYWCADPEYNKLFILHVMDHMNMMLKAKGHVFLNEVYDALGLSRSSEGQIVGWIYEEDNPFGDNHIDFEFDEEKREALMSGKAVLLDFNVDGNIVNRIWKEEL